MYFSEVGGQRPVVPLVTTPMSQEEKYLSSRTERTENLYSQLINWSFDQGERIWDVFVYSSLYISVIALTEVGIAMMLLGLELNLAPLVVGLVTFAVYTNDRIADAETDAMSMPGQAAFVRRYEGVLYVAAAAAYGLAVAISVLAGPVALLITLLPGMFWILYGSNWLDGHTDRFDRLKEILFVNTAVVALGWSVTVVFLPLAFSSASLSPHVGIVFAYLFFRDFVHTEIPNVPDRFGDERIGVATIPVVFGLDGTRHALYLVNLATAAVVGLGLVYGYVTATLGLVLAVAICYSLAVTASIGRSRRETFLAKLAEGEYPITLTGLLAVTFLL